MTRIVIKRGHDDWDDLVGKEIEFEWSVGGDDYYTPRFVFHATRVYAEDPRYPRYYILDEDLGGYSVWEDEEVKVTVHD